MLDDLYELLNAYERLIDAGAPELTDEAFTDAFFPAIRNLEDRITLKLLELDHD